MEGVGLAHRKSIAQGEIQNVVNALRKNGKWGKSLTKFRELREQLYTLSDLRQLNTTKLFEPFLHVISSKKSRGHLNKVALTSVKHLLQSQFLDVESTDCREIVNQIVEIVLRSKFADVTRPEVEETVELALLKTLLECVRNPVGIYVKHELILDSLAKFFEMGTKARKTDLFQDAVETLLRSYLDALFAPLMVKGEDHSALGEDHHRFVLIHKVILYLCSLLSKKPTEQQPEMEQMQLLGVQELGYIVSHYFKTVDQLPPSVVELLKNQVCKSLLLMIRSHNLAILTTSLRIFFNIFVSLKKGIKLQLEQFLVAIINHVLENKKSSFSQQEVALELIVELLYQPAFITDLFVNYDSDLYCGNVFETLCRYLSKNAFPVSGSLNSKHLLSLDGLQAIMRTIADYCNVYKLPTVPSKPLTASLSGTSPPGSPAPSSPRKSWLHLLDYTPTEHTPIDTFREMKQAKELLIVGIDRFNIKPKDGIKSLQESGLLPETLDGAMIAKFIRNTPRLDKTTVGNYLGDRGDINIEALQHFIRAVVVEFSQDPLALVSTVRAFLESFRLPGDAHVISRIFENFGRIYYEFHKESPHMPFENPDVIYIMCYSMVMLNTDLHNPAIKKKMTMDEFIKRTTDMPDTKNIPHDVLRDIYIEIRDNEIKIPDEHPDEGINDNSWQSMIRRSKKSMFIETSHSAELVANCNRDIFSMIWGPLLVAFYVVFDTTYDDTILSQAQQGFHSCAMISAYYNLDEVFDNLVISICKFSTLPQLSASSENPNKLADYVANKKAHLATLTLFEIIRNHATHLRESWKNIVDCIVILCKLNMLPGLLDLPNFLQYEGAEAVQPEKAETGYMNPLGYLLDYSKWWGSGTAAVPEKPKPPPQADEAEKVTREVIEKCRIKEIVEDTKTLQADSLVYLVKAIILSSNKSPKSETEFYLDLLTKVSILNEFRISYLWVVLSEYFVNLIASSSGELLEKSISNFLLLCNNLLEKSAQGDPIIKSLEVLEKLKELKRPLEIKIAFGVSKLVENHAQKIEMGHSWKILFNLLAFLDNPTASAFKFKALSFLVPSTITGQTQSYLTKDNFQAFTNCVVGYVKSNDAKLAQIPIQAMELLRTQFSLIGEVFHFQDCTPEDVDQAWNECLTPLLEVFCLHWRDKRPAIREAAQKALRTVLMESSLKALSPAHWHSLIDKILFALLTDLISPSASIVLPMEHLGFLRLQAIQLLSKIFLHYLPKISLLPGKEFEELWLKIVNFIEQYIQESHENLQEEIKEVLKNMILVMNMSEVLKPPEEQQEESLKGMWQLTWTKVDTFCPNLKEEIFGADPNTTPQVPVFEPSAVPVHSVQIMSPSSGPQNLILPTISTTEILTTQLSTV